MLIKYFLLGALCFMIALPILDALVDLITTSINALKTFLLLVIQKNQFKMTKMEEDNSPRMN